MTDMASVASIADVADSGLTSVSWWIARTGCKLVILVACEVMNHFPVLLYACDNPTTMPHSAPRKCQCVVSLCECLKSVWVEFNTNVNTVIDYHMSE